MKNGIRNLRRNLKTTAFLSVFVLFRSLNALSHGGGEATIEIGPEKGVIAVHADRSFELAPEAIQSLGIASETLAIDPRSGKSVFWIESRSIAHSLDEKKVFRVRAGRIKAVEVEILGRSSGKTRIRSNELLPGDSIVSKGVGFLQALSSQIEAPETERDHSEKGHSHHD